MKTSTIIWLAVLSTILIGVGLLPSGGGEVEAKPQSQPVEGIDLSQWSAMPPGREIRVLFLHHSCGGTLLAEPGSDLEEVPGACIWKSHPNGGGLRKKLEEQGYTLAEVSYGSILGQDTDLFDWLPKFRQSMDAIHGCAGQDEVHVEGQANEVVAFKSCFPNNYFTGPGDLAGNPAGPELTLSNAKAAFRALLPEFEKHPETLFVYLTAPPLAPKLASRRFYHRILDALRGREGAGRRYVKAADHSRQFNDWLKHGNGWLKDYSEKNVVVFDYYNILTNEGSSNLSMFASQGGFDSHPNRAGNAKVADRFPPFLNRSVRRASLVANR